jgi:leucyl-tRNA synthetase
MIEFVNAATAGGLTIDQIERFALILCPFAPHLAEELWSKIGKKDLASLAAWPRYEQSMLHDSEVELPVQVMGKIRARIVVPADADVKAVEAIAMADAKVKECLAGKSIKKVIVVPGKLVNVVVG